MTMNDGNKVRLNRYISECGIASRRKADEMIEQGRVTINGKTITQMGITVDPTVDLIKVDGESVRKEKKVYFLLNKPKGFITTTKDEKNRPNVTELIHTNLAIFPVGRLDFNTTGILLLTNDGDFAQQLTHPKFKVARIYNVGLNKDFTGEMKEKLLRGVMLDRKKSKFESIEYLVKNKFDKVQVITSEGRNHFVKRMFLTVGLQVRTLERAAFGPFTVENIPQGKYIEVSAKDIFEVMNEYNR